MKVGRPVRIINKIFERNDELGLGCRGRKNRQFLRNF